MAAVLITGASGGIGAATARLAARAGYAVGVHYHRNRAAAEAVVAAIRDGGGTAEAFAGNVGEEAAVAALFAACDARLGPLTALVNNAGVLEQQCRLDETDAGRWERVLRTNVIGAFLCAKAAVLRLSTRHGGSGGAIVNVSSVAARLGAPGEYVDYAASKGALDTMTIGLAKEVAAEGVRVNGVRPGIIRTSIHARGGEPGRVDRMAPTLPMGRAGEPDEVASVILWLLSDAASYVTGTLVDVSGGR